jgi:hypothetical protein
VRLRAEALAARGWVAGLCLAARDGFAVGSGDVLPRRRWAHRGDGVVRSWEGWFGLAAMNGHSFRCLWFEVLWRLRTDLVDCWNHDPMVIGGAQGGLEINMRMEG